MCSLQLYQAIDCFSEFLCPTVFVIFFRDISKRWHTQSDAVLPASCFASWERERERETTDDRQTETERAGGDVLCWTVLMSLLDGQHRHWELTGEKRYKCWPHCRAVECNWSPETCCVRRKGRLSETVPSLSLRTPRRNSRTSECSPSNTSNITVIISLSKARRWRTTNVRDAWPVRRQTYGYLPSHKASPPIGWYQIILLDNRGTRVLTSLTCPTRQRGG